MINKCFAFQPSCCIDSPAVDAPTLVDREGPCQLTIRTGALQVVFEPDTELIGDSCSIHGRRG
jgi:hypothetical protein